MRLPESLSRPRPAFPRDGGGLAIALAIALAGVAAVPAEAGETQCWIDNGAVVVPAVFGDVSGDFILDLSAPRSQLHLTTAQSAGYSPDPEPPASAAGTLTLAGQRIPANLDIVDLDARQWGFPTTLNGLIGADVFAGYVVKLRLAPCRLSLNPPAAAGKVLRRLPIAEAAGVPTIAASISDGARTRMGKFAIDTGAAGVRMAADHARFSRLSARVDPLSRDRPPATLAALSFGGLMLRDQSASLATDLPDGVTGGIGTNVWMRYVLRLDFRRRTLELSLPPPSWDGKRVSGPRSARSGDSWRRAVRRR